MIVSVCCVYVSSAQKNIAQRLNDVLLSKNADKAKVLFQEIKKKDIDNLSESALLDYYYLAGWVSSEYNNSEKQIEYLSKAKELCETKLGIHKNVLVYFEILKALGEVCEDLKRNEEALLWYEEGLVKAFPYIHTKNANLQYYITAMRNNAANIYEKKGYKEFASLMRPEKPFDYIGSFDYACELLDSVGNMYRSNRFRDAIALLDEAKGIFKISGDKGKEMMQPLNRWYLLSYARMRDEQRLNALLKAKGKSMFYDGSKSYLIDYMYEVISIFLLDHHDVKTAEYYYQKLSKEIAYHNQPEEVKRVEKIGSEVQVFKRLYTQLDSLENVRASLPKSTYEWGLASYRLSRIFIALERVKEANEICEQIYPMSVSLIEDPQKLHWFVLDNLVSINMQTKAYEIAERYVKEQMNWSDAHNVPKDAEERGWAYNILGIIYLNKGVYDQADKMFANAERILLPLYGDKSQAYATIIHNKGRLAQLDGRLDDALKYLEEAECIQIALHGQVQEKTKRYLKEVKNAIKVRL